MLFLLRPTIRSRRYHQRHHRHHQDNDHFCFVIGILVLILVANLSPIQGILLPKTTTIISSSLSIRSHTQLRMQQTRIQLSLRKQQSSSSSSSHSTRSLLLLHESNTNRDGTTLESTFFSDENNDNNNNNNNSDKDDTNEKELKERMKVLLGEINDTKTQLPLREVPMQKETKEKETTDSALLDSFSYIPPSTISTVETTITTRTSSTSIATDDILERVSSVLLVLLGSISMSMLFSSLLVQYEWFQTWRYWWPLIGGLYILDPILYYTMTRSNLPTTTTTAAQTNTFGISSDMAWKATKQTASNEVVTQNEIGNQLNDSLQFVQEEKHPQREELSLLPFRLPHENLFLSLTSIVGGIFTIVGGAYDAFMPVWQTGPNVFTIAGIGQDGATILLLVSCCSILIEFWNSSSSSNNNNNNNTEKIKRNVSASSGRTTNVSLPSMVGNTNTWLLLQCLLLAELYKLGESSVDEIISTVSGTMMIS